MEQSIIALIAVAISFIDGELGKMPPTSEQAKDYADVRMILVSAIDMLRGNTSKFDVAENTLSRISNRKPKK